uniref:Uncharacterized protein n=1 Tax=Rhizophora mucronata TaxID=61149 RepID=A0A2P2QPE6_RHIMU
MGDYSEDVIGGPKWWSSNRSYNHTTDRASVNQ